MDIKHLARLARVELGEEEERLIAPQLQSILTYVGKLAEVDTTSISPATYITDALNVLREDRAEACDPDVRERCVEAFPRQEGRLLQVPGIFDRREGSEGKE